MIRLQATSQLAALPRPVDVDPHVLLELAGEVLPPTLAVAVGDKPGRRSTRSASGVQPRGLLGKMLVVLAKLFYE